MYSSPESNALLAKRGASRVQPPGVRKVVKKTVLKDVRFLNLPDVGDDVEPLRPEAPDVAVDTQLEARRVAAGAIGRNIARLRLAAGLDLAALAERSGIGADQLALVESGRGFPGLRLVWRLASALSVPFGALLDDAMVSEASDGEFRVQRASEGHTLGSPGGLLSRVLSPEGVLGAPEVYELTLRAGGAEAAEGHGRATCEHIVVTAGNLVVQAGDREVTLGPGDSLFFRADLAHRYVNPGGTEVRALLVMVYA